MTQLKTLRRGTDNWTNEFDRFFENFFAPVTNQQEFGFNFSPKIDVRETEDCYLISADLPGMSEQDISIELKDRVLTISGERSYEKKDEKLHRFERNYGRFQRSFQLPENINLEKIEANYENGVLDVLVPREEASKPKSINVGKGKGGLFSTLTGKEKSKEVAS